MKLATMKLAARWLATASLALVPVGCGDELALRVVVHHPAEAAVARTVVSIYESSSTTCKQIELGDLSTAQLEAILVTQQAIGEAGAGALEGISRVDRKLVVARGEDAMGRLLTAGCTEKEEITGRDVVEVDTDFAVTLSIGAIAAGDVGIPITLTDAEGRSRPGHRVSWRVYGPHGATPHASGAALAPGEDESWELAQPACTNAAGVARLHPVPPAAVGGYAIELRPSWPAKSNPLLTSFTKIDPTQAPIDPNPNVTRPCAIRVAGGTRRLVCLQLGAGGVTIAREYDIAVSGGNARLQLRGQATVDAGVVALFSIARGGDRDVYAVAADAQVFGVFGPSVPPDPDPHLATGAVTDALLLPVCDPAAGQAPQLLLRVASASGKRVQAMTPLGGTVADYHNLGTDALLPLALRGTGCVTELRPNSTEPKRRQAAIVDINRRVMPSEQRTTSSVVFECDLADSSKCIANLPVPGGGAGLSAAPVPGAPPPGSGPGEEPQLTGMFFDATGVVMSSWVLLPNPNGEFLLVERGRVPAASIPNRVVTGDFDGDGKADLFWDLPSLVQPTSNFQATYGRTIGDLRLSALSGAEPILVDDLVAGDLTGDNLDDLVIFGRQRREDDLGNVTITTGIIVVPMNVAAPNPDPMSDKPCP